MVKLPAGDLKSIDSSGQSSIETKMYLLFIPISRYLVPLINELEMTKREYSSVEKTVIDRERNIDLNHALQQDAPHKKM